MQLQEQRGLFVIFIFCFIELFHLFKQQLQQLPLVIIRKWPFWAIPCPPII